MMAQVLWDNPLTICGIPAPPTPRIGSLTSGSYKWRVHSEPAPYATGRGARIVRHEVVRHEGARWGHTETESERAQVPAPPVIPLPQVRPLPSEIALDGVPRVLTRRYSQQRLDQRAPPPRHPPATPRPAGGATPLTLWGAVGVSPAHRL